MRVDELLDIAAYDAAAAELVILDAVLLALPSVAERRRLLDGPLRTLTAAARAVEAAAAQDAPAPDFLDVAARALDVHDQVRRFHAIAEDPSTRALAEELSSLTEDVMQDARHYLGAKIQARILEGFRKPSFLASLEAFRKAIGSSPKRYERFEELKNSPTFDIDVLTDVFPCWIMRPEDVCRVFPLRSDVFDVVIVDEASQCNPDQVLPLFARSSRALIVGDDKQLSNEDLRRSLSTNANTALLRQAELDRLDPAGLFDQTQNSLLELTSRRQQASVLLNEHFRCRPEIVAFSNHRFYGDTLTVIRDREDDHGLGPALILREVNAPPAAIYGKVNRAEARALVDELHKRLQDDRYAGMSFGVLSLFREQVEYLEQEIERAVPLAQRQRHRLICSTVDGFQGDERDVILYSWRYSETDHPAVFAFTNGGAGEQRTNVALTRARHQAIHFISVPVEQFPASAVNVSAYLRHAADPNALLRTAEGRAHREPTGPSRQALAAALTDAGLRVVQNYVACGVSVDLLVDDDIAAKRVAVFVDADRATHRPPDTPERVDQQAVLERAGWTVVRAPATETLPLLSASVELILAALQRSRALRTVDGPDEAAHDTIEIDENEVPITDPAFLDLEIAAEDRADYHWEVASVEKRLAAGEAVFHSDFERDLYTMLARHDDLRVVPQWPARGKSIDLVITDRQGRRLAVEADGAHHHETSTGALIPEDLERQALLEEAGWSFSRVRHKDFNRDPDAQVELILQTLATRDPNPALADFVWTDAAVEDALSTAVEIAEPTAEPALVTHAAAHRRIRPRPAPRHPAAARRSRTRSRRHRRSHPRAQPVRDHASRDRRSHGSISRSRTRPTGHRACRRHSHRGRASSRLAVARERSLLDRGCRAGTDHVPARRSPPRPRAAQPGPARRRLRQPLRTSRAAALAAHPQALRLDRQGPALRRAHRRRDLGGRDRNPAPRRPLRRLDLPQDRPTRRRDARLRRRPLRGSARRGLRRDPHPQARHESRWLRHQPSKTRTATAHVTAVPRCSAAPRAAPDQHSGRLRRPAGATA